MLAKSGLKSGFLSAFCNGAGCEFKTGLTRNGFISLFYMDQKPDCKKADFFAKLISGIKSGFFYSVFFLVPGEC